MLMRAEPEEMTVRRLAQRPRGGSGNNPFLKPTRSAMEYTVLIEPQNIAKKIMQVHCLAFHRKLNVPPFFLAHSTKIIPRPSLHHLMREKKRGENNAIGRSRNYFVGVPGMAVYRQARRLVQCKTDSEMPRDTSEVGGNICKGRPVLKRFSFPTARNIFHDCRNRHKSSKWHTSCTAVAFRGLFFSAWSPRRSVHSVYVLSLTRVELQWQVPS